VQEETGDASASDEPGSALSVDLTRCKTGRVVKVHGLDTVVEAEDGTLVRCDVRRILKTLAIDGRNVVAVGDRVWYLPGAEAQGVIEKVESRHGTILRSYQHRKH